MTWDHPTRDEKISAAEFQTAARMSENWETARACTTCRHNMEDDFAPPWCLAFKVSLEDATHETTGACGPSRIKWEQKTNE